jgi:hypothetical protein
LSTPESLVAALARGLVEGLLGQEKAAKKERPVVVKQEDVRAAVENFLKPLIAEETPSAPQMDLFTHGIENAPTDPIAEMTLRRVAEARERAERQGAEEPQPGTFDPNMPGGSPWTSPQRDAV